MISGIEPGTSGTCCAFIKEPVVLLVRGAVGLAKLVLLVKQPIIGARIAFDLVGAVVQSARVAVSRALHAFVIGHTIVGAHGA